MKLKRSINSSLAMQKECAALSLLIYHDENEPVIPDGLVKLNVSCHFKAGFYAETYINEAFMKECNAVQCIIVFRGTNSVVDVIQDYLILMDEAPDYFIHDAIPYVEAVKKYVQEYYHQADEFLYTYTGHSLGALLAQLCCCREFDPIRKLPTAICVPFDSPGAKTIAEKLVVRGILPEASVSVAHQYQNVYLSDVNAINTCHPQLGNIVPHNIPYIFENLSLPSLISYVKDFTFRNQHRMVGFFTYWHRFDFKQDSTIYYARDKWPVGLQNGLDYYLNYDKRRRYWDNYMQAMWDQNPNWHDAYENDLSKFEADFKKKFLRQESSKFYVLIDKLPAYSLFHKKHSYHVEIEKDALPSPCKVD